MASTQEQLAATVRYQPDERPPTLLSIGLGAQLAILTIGGVVFTPMIVVQAGGGSQSFLNWAVFAAVVVSGITTVIQAVRIGRIGAGHVLCMGTSGAFIAICVAAIAEGGPAMLATLVVVSSLFQFILSQRLSLFRKIFSPIVAGVVIMMIPVTVIPIVLNNLEKVPEGASPLAAPLCAAFTIIVVLAIALKAKGIFRLWALVIGVVLGALVGAYFGIYDGALVANAAWFGLPDGSWGGFDLDFGPVFWSLLPAFIFVTLIGAIETIGDGVAIQRVSWRDQRAVDFRVVQGAVAADGLGNLLSGLAGTVPNTTYSTSVAVTELTGVGARAVGAVLGIFFVLIAFSPKLLALIMAIPAPVVSAYLVILLAMLFVVGMKIVIQDGVDYRKSIVAGVSFWLGVGFQNGLIFPEIVAEFAGGLLNNGMTAGGLVAIVLTVFIELTHPRAKRIEVDLDASNLPKIMEFLRQFAAHHNWSERMVDRLLFVSEELLMSIIEDRKVEQHVAARRLRLTATKDSNGAVLEFIAAIGDENFEDRLAVIGEQMTETSIEKEFSLKILKHFASSVRHQQYHDTDIITAHVELPTR